MGTRKKKQAVVGKGKPPKRKSNAHSDRETDTPHEVKKVADGPDDRSAELLWVSNSKLRQEIIMII